MAIPQQYEMNKWLNFSHIVCLKNEKKLGCAGLKGALPLCAGLMCALPPPPLCAYCMVTCQTYGHVTAMNGEP